LKYDGLDSGDPQRGEAVKGMLRLCISFASVLLPWSLRRALLARIFGWDIHPEARIGLCAIDSDRVTLAQGSRIAHLTMVRNLGELNLAKNAVIGSLNSISSVPAHSPHFSASKRVRSLSVGEESAITHRHQIDCTDRVVVGRFSVMAGSRSQILTHSVNIADNRQDCAPVVIGDYSFVGTSVILLAGSTVPSRSVVGAGSVVVHGLTQAETMYAGVPAKALSTFEGTEAYFHRARGIVV
jgi:acetyltransferase-like isoleucine patch superfamily enzyme